MGFFMTIITASTVGYGETHELSSIGRVFTAALIVLCVICMTLVTASLTSFILEHDLSGNFARKRMQKMIAKLKNHTIVCGCGPMAEAIIERLVRNRVSVVVVAEDKEKLEALGRRFRKLLFSRALPPTSCCWPKAGVLKASNVVAALESEVDNLLVAITCKDMGRNIAVFARSNDITIANRLRKAGAEVISPNQLCGDRIAGLICDETPSDETQPEPQLV